MAPARGAVQPSKYAHYAHFGNFVELLAITLVRPGERVSGSFEALLSSVINHPHILANRVGTCKIVVEQSKQLTHVGIGYSGPA